MIVLIVRNPMDPGSWERIDTDDLVATMRAEFPTWPSLGRIYDLDGIGDPESAIHLVTTGNLSARDVTPPPPGGDTSRLERAAGPLLITVQPNDPVTATITVAVTLAAVAIGLFLLPKPPNADNTPSASKSLSDRTNKPRPYMRIEDHFGTVRAVPSMLAVPYRRFDSDLEVEIGYMCVGRGAYDIADVRDGDTLLSAVAGASAEFYGPNTSPNSGDAPQLRIGSAINTPVLSVVSVGSVNGQLLRPPNANHVSGDENIRFVYPDRIETTSSSIDFTELFEPNDNLTIGGADFGSSGAAGTTSIQASSRFEFGGIIRFEAFDPSTVFAAGQYLTVTNGGWAESDGISSTIYVDLSGAYQIAAVNGSTVTLSDPAGINTDWEKLDELDSDRTGYRSSQFAVPTATTAINLAGTYPVLDVNAKSIVLSNPSNINAAWVNIEGLDGGATAYGSPSLSTSGERWVGPFVIDLSDLDRVIANFVGLSGLYSINKKNKQHAIQVGVELELTPVDTNDNPSGSPELFPGTLIGSATDKDQVGLTVDGVPSFTGPCSMRARRTTPTDLDYDGTLVDDVKWRDAYGAAQVLQSHFGNVTTVLAKTYATTGATSQKERKLNLRARRRVPQRLPGGGFSDVLVGSDNMADIFCAAALDPYIGARSVGELAVPLIYSTSDAIAAYFGSSLAREFSYTFDDDNTSFEETAQIIAQACFCQAYREGVSLKIAFEKATEDPALLFNHRNVLPDSQTRTVRFGVLDDQDGVELSYTVPKDGAKLSITLPSASVPNSPRTVELPGIGTGLLAWWQAQRAWNRMRFQNVAVELEATEEAALVLPQQRVLITDMTRPDHLSGEVRAQAGTLLTLSDPVSLEDGREYVMFLQLQDATVQAIAVAPAGLTPPDPYKVTLAAVPRLPLVVDDDAVTKTIYSIAPDQEARERAFLVSEREPNSDFTETVRAVNYTFLYYQHDQLLLWLPFTRGGIADESAWGGAVEVIGPAATVLDDDRGHYVYTSPSPAGFLSVPDLIGTPSYTKSAWVRVADPGPNGSIISSSADANEAFWITGGLLASGHNGAWTAVNVAYPTDGLWHHAAVTYDADSTELILYLDGVPVSRIGHPQRALGGLSVFSLTGGSGLIGRADDVRIYPRALSPDELRAIYRSTR
jgi:hypothetical protein